MRMLETHALSFKRQTYLFENLNLHIKPGTLVQITGPNGAGKTTLLRILAGFLPPSSGEICYKGHSITKTITDYQNTIGYLGHVNPIKPALTLEENIGLHALLMGTEVTEINILLQQLRLEALRKQFVYQLSAGQQRKVALMNLMLAKRPLWLLDEPFSSLDDASIESIKTALLTHLGNGGIALVTTHHSLDLLWDSIECLAL